MRVKLFNSICRGLKRLATQWWSELQDFLIAKSWGWAALYISAPISLIALLCALVVLLVTVFDRHGMAILEALWLPLAILSLLVWMICRNPGSGQPKKVEPDSLGEAFAKENWTNVANIMLRVLESSAANLGLSIPFGVEDIDCPAARVVPRGRVFIYQFSVQKANASADVDVVVIRNVLQQRITNGLNHSRFEGVSEAVVLVDGVSYPVYMVDDVRDHLGMVTISLVQPSAAYISQLRMHKQAQTAINSSGRPPIDSEL